MKALFKKPTAPAVAALAAALLTCAVARAQAPRTRETLLRQVASVLDYVASDYAGAISPEGAVLDASELAEQRELVGEAQGLGRRAGLAENDAATRALADVARGLDAHVPPERLRELCRAARHAVVEGHGLVLEPTSVPDLARARTLFASQGCTGCHGAHGGGDGAAGARLTPKPANFLDPARTAGMSPNRAYGALTFGIEGTGMRRFDWLSSPDRWSLAFYVLALRHSERDARAGRALVGEVPTAAGPLSQLTDDELVAALPEPVRADATKREEALAFLRRTAPFDDAGDGVFTVARTKLRDGLELYRSGDARTARSLFVSAYLDGVEPHEAPLRATRPELLRALERAMMGVRDAAAAGVPPHEEEARVREALELLDRAERGETSARATFVGAAAIALREGFEAALLIAALLGLVRKRGRPEHARFVHAGWLAAIPAGFLTWLAVRSVLSGLARETAEGIVSLVAAVVLLGVTHWIVGQASAKSFVGFVARRLGDVLGAAGPAEAGPGARPSWLADGAAWGVFSLAFFAAYREAVEIVLFYQALLYDAGEHASMVWLGALAGVVVLVAVVLALRAVGQKIPPRPFMLASSVLLALLAVVMVGKGVRSLQEAGLVVATTNGWPELPSLGVFATNETWLAQGVLAVALVVSAVVPLLRARRERDAAAPAAR